jgi:hypothetical protein
LIFGEVLIDSWLIGREEGYGGGFELWWWWPVGKGWPALIGIFCKIQKEVEKKVKS